MIDPIGASTMARTASSCRPEASAKLLTACDVRTLLAACADTPYGQRDRALLALIYAAALRSSDAVALRVEDIDVSAGTVSLYRTGARTELPLDDLTVAAVDRWLRRRTALGIGQDMPLFCTFNSPRPLGLSSEAIELAVAKHGSICAVARAIGRDESTVRRGLNRGRAAGETDRSPGERPTYYTTRSPGSIHPQNLRHIIRGLAERAGIAKPVSAEALRRARAYELAWSGESLAALHALFGHRSINSTREYIARVAPGSPGLEWLSPAQLAAPEQLEGQRPMQARRFALAELAETRRGQPPPNAGRRFPPEVLTEREVLALMDACNHGASGRRNRALIALLWRSGLRIAEALALYSKDVDRDRGIITVLHGKGDKWRMVGVDPQTIDELDLWLAVRAELGVGEAARLFCCLQGTQRGGPMRPSLIRDMLKRQAARVGIHKAVRPHGFRHTHAFELANESTPTMFIKKQLGHSSLAVTERYIDHLAPVAVIRHMQGRSWGGGKPSREAGLRVVGGTQSCPPRADR